MPVGLRLDDVDEDGDAESNAFTRVTAVNGELNEPRVPVGDRGRINITPRADRTGTTNMATGIHPQECHIIAAEVGTLVKFNASVLPLYRK
jgi:hypothetical protein